MGIGATSLLHERKDSLPLFIAGSVAFHVCAFGLLALLSRDQEPAIQSQRPITASLVRKGKPRDEKLLPRKEELPPSPKKVEGKTAPPPTPAPAKPDVKAVAIPGVKPDSNPAPAKQEGKADGAKSLFNAIGKTATRASEEEPEGEAEGDPDGTAAKAEGERYFALLKGSIERHYDVSNTLTEQERLYLKATLSVKISKNGELLDVALVTPSGNDLFDNAVLSAVRKAAPFSPPPEHLRAQLQSQGQAFRFTP